VCSAFSIYIYIYIYIYIVLSYLNDSLTSIKFPWTRLKKFVRISLPPAKEIWQI